MERINTVCSAYPCHEGLEDCTFCYCPFYPCGQIEHGGRHLTVYKGTVKEKIWDCTGCNWIHKKNFVDKVFEIIREETKVRNEK